MSMFNTAAGWVLAGGIVALGSSIVVGEMFHAERPETMGYVVEGVEEHGGEGEGEMTMGEAFISPDVTAARGETIFGRCTQCHTINQGGANGTGPNLYGMVGRDIASVSGFGYSGGLSAIEGSWNFDNMSEWLKSPRQFADGTSMSFAGLSDPLDRAALLLYLNENGSNMPMPEPPVEDETVAEDEEIMEEEAADPEAEAATAAEVAPAE